MSRRLSVRAADQLVNSASSAIFSLGLVAVTDNAELGAIAIQMTALPMLLGLARTSVYEGILFRLTGTDRARTQWVPVLVGLVGGFLGALVSLGIGIIVDLDTQSSLAIATATGLVLLFDGLRFSAFVGGADTTALRADIAWLVLTALAVAAVVSQADLTAERLAWCYGGAALVSVAGFGHLIRTVRPSSLPSGLLREFRFGADFVLQVAPGQIALAAAALVTTFDAVGSLRAAVTLFSPLATLVYAVRLTLIDRAGSGWKLSPSTTYAVLTVAYGTAITLAFGAFTDSAARLFGALPSSVLVLVAIGELARHLTQAQVDQNRLADQLRSAMNMRSAQAILLIGASIALSPLFTDDGLALARVIAFGGPLIALWFVGARRATT